MNRLNWGLTEREKWSPQMMLGASNKVVLDGKSTKMFNRVAMQIPP